MQKLETDVLVCGAGSAGVGAAIQAGRNGAKTLIVEMQNCLGGMATAGMMSHWGGRSSSKIMLELFDRTREKSKIFGWEDKNDCELFAIHHEAQKIVLEEMMKEASVDILYNTIVCGVKKSKNAIEGVYAQNKSGRIFIKCKVVVDATGDGDVAYYAGVPFFKGRESDGKMQPATLMFKIGGVDYDKAVFPGGFESLVYTNKGELQALSKQKIPYPAGHVLLYRQPTSGTVCCNMTNSVGVDGTDAADITKATIECRGQIEYIIKFLKEYVPGYKNCWLMSSASLLGIRETRHFKGVESLSADDILTAKFYNNWIVKKAWFTFDVHNLTGASRDETAVQNNFSQNKDYTIPYGCVLTEQFDNLLLSGRNISGSHLAHSNFRVMPIAIAIGEATGVASALFCKKNLQSLKDLDVCEIQRILG